MTLWGGRFDEAPDRRLWDFTVTVTDRRLLADDVEGSIAHASMLRHVGLLSEVEHEAIHQGLLRILADAHDGTFEFVESDEDVHSAVERRLVELAGDAGAKLHTGRSRSRARLATRSQPVMPPQFDASGWIHDSFDSSKACSNSIIVCRFSPMASGMPVVCAMRP